MAEDTAIQAKKLCFYLNKIGYEVVWVQNGIEALKKLEVENFDLVITDVQMPEMDGLTLVAEIRKFEKWKHLPVIVVTTLEDLDIRIVAIRNGASDFLQKPYSIEELELRAKNQVQLYEYSRNLKNENNELTNVLINTNKELEIKLSELQKAHEELKRMQTELVRAGKMSTLAMLGAGLAHEISNPLTIINAYAQKLKNLSVKGQITPTLIESNLETIAKQTNRITSIIQQLRRASGRSDGAVLLRSLPLHEFVEGISSLLASINTGHIAEIETQILNDDAIAQINETSLSQVVLNLVQNAIHALEGRESPTIKIIIRKDNDFAFMDISDNGSGIPEAIQSKIFDPFFTTKGEKKGTGLGLSLCQTYLKDMNGGIDFKTGPTGTTFTIYIPLVKSEQKASNG